MTVTSMVERSVDSEDTGRMFPPADYCGITCFEPDGHLRALRAIEGDVLRLAIATYGGRLCEVARHLRISRSTVYRKLDEFGITPPRA